MFYENGRDILKIKMKFKGKFMLYSRRREKRVFVICCDVKEVTDLSLEKAQRVTQDSNGKMMFVMA